MILAADGTSLLSVSCGGCVPLTDEAIEQAQNQQFRAGPAEVTDAVMEVFEETDNPFDMHIERTSETFALAERTAMLYMLISSSINNCRFVFKAEPGPKCSSLRLSSVRGKGVHENASAGRTVR